MNKPMFLNGLRRAIAQLPDEEIEKNIAYYNELIDDRMEEGMTEEEAVDSMEPIAILAERAYDMYRTPPVPVQPQQTYQQTAPQQGQQRQQPKQQPKKQRSTGLTVLLIILAVLASPIWIPLAIVAFFIVLTIAAALLGLMAAIVAVVLAIGIGGLAILFYCIFHAGVLGLPALFVLGGCIFCVGLCILLFFPAVALVKLIWRGLKAFFRWIGSLFRGKKNKQQNDGQKQITERTEGR